MAPPSQELEPPINPGRFTLLIEGDDGTRLTKQQIVTALKNPETIEPLNHVD